MPYVLVEATYEGEYNAPPVQIRRQAYWAMLCGATGQFVGNYPIWGFYPGWQAAMDATASTDMEILLRLFKSRASYDLVPDQMGPQRRRLTHRSHAPRSGYSGHRRT